jgi:hypothetical protein
MEFGMWSNPEFQACRIWNYLVGVSWEYLTSPHARVHWNVGIGNVAEFPIPIPIPVIWNRLLGNTSPDTMPECIGIGNWERSQNPNSNSNSNSRELEFGIVLNITHHS